MALQAFLQGEKKSAFMQSRQYDNFLTEMLIDSDIREELYDLRKKADEQYSQIVRLLTLITWVLNDILMYRVGQIFMEKGWVDIYF